VLLLATAATYAYALREAPHWGATAQDWAARLRPAPAADSVVVVMITDQDYREIFHGHYPLEPAPLRRLLEAVAVGGPPVIGVDVATAEPQYRALPAVVGQSRVVWAADAAPCAGGEGCSEDELLPTPVLGGREGARVGLGYLSPDHDGVFRRYRRTVGRGESRVPSFAWSVALALRETAAGGGGPAPGDDTEDAFLIPFHASAPATITAGEVLRLSGTPGFRENGPLRGRAVLVGGDYAGRDLHRTPVGTMPGVHVWARVVAAELRHGLLRVPGAGAVALIAFFEGLLCVFLFHARPVRQALAATLLLLPAVAAGCSLLLAESLELTWYFLPVLVLVLVVELFERAKEFRNQGMEALIGGEGHPTR
jgi:CHASE2 domain-containing sensor protein